jgi:hypothetical protein
LFGDRVLRNSDSGKTKTEKVMWDKLSKVQGAIALAVIGTVIISIFMMVMILVAANEDKWDLADKWLTMLFTSLVCNAFLGYLYVKAQQHKSS